MRTRARIVAFAIAALVLPAAARADEPPAPVAPSAEPVPGCLGTVTFCAHDLPPEVCQALDALMDYAFFCGSGYKTTQGWGQTRLTDRK